MATRCVIERSRRHADAGPDRAAHAHLSWPTSLERFVPGMALPPEDLLLNTARNARVLLDQGFTSAYSGGALGRTLETSLKAHIDSGSMPGPRLIPSSLEREPEVADASYECRPGRQSWQRPGGRSAICQDVR